MSTETLTPQSGQVVLPINLTTFEILQLATQIHGVMRDKGWYESERSNSDKGMLIASEAFEAFEDYRDQKMALYFTDTGKPCGFVSEIADIAIRCLDTLGDELCNEFEHGIENTYPSKPLSINVSESRDIPSILRNISMVALDEVGGASCSDYLRIALVGIIRACDDLIAERFKNTTLREQIHIKMEYNKTRPHRHGGKTI